MKFNILEELIDLTPEIEIKQIYIGVYSIFVKSSKRSGISSTLHRYIEHRPPKDIERLERLNLKALASYIKHDNLLEASLGMAAVNAGIPHREELFTEVNAFEIIKEKGAGKTISVIGDFPFVGKLKKNASKVNVFEKKSGPGFYREEDMPEILPQSDLVVISGTTIFNHTLEGILDNCSSESFKLMLGPSTPLTTAMFDLGLDAVAGVVVEDEEKIIKYITRAAPFKFLKGKRYITMLKKGSKGRK